MKFNVLRVLNNSFKISLTIYSTFKELNCNSEFCDLPIQKFNMEG